MKQVKFRSLLKKLARNSTHHRSHHAAVVAQGKRVLGVGWNREGHHAELVALLSTPPKELKGATLYTLMVRPKTGDLGDGSPCPTCMEAIRQNRLRKVVVYL